MASKNFYGKSFVTAEFRMSFPHLFKADAFNANQTAKFSVVMVMPSKGMALVRKELEAAAEGKWGPDRKKWPANVRKMDFATYCSPNAKDGFPVRCGDDVEYEGYEGMEYVKASTTKAPGVVGLDRQPILDEAEAHAGVIARARIQAFAYERPDGSGVALSLEHVLIVKDDGTNWGGGSRVRAEDAFGDFTSPDGSEDRGNYATGTDDL